MKTNFVIFSLLALSSSPLFCANAEQQLAQAKNQSEDALKQRAQNCIFKRNGDTVLVTFENNKETLDLNNTCETFFEASKIGVNISRDTDPRNPNHIIAQVFTKDTDHTLTKTQGTELLRKNHPILLSRRLYTEDELQQMRLADQLRAIKIAERTAPDSDDDFS